MVGETLDLLRHAVGSAPLDDLDNPGVEGAALVMHQALVGHHMGQRMLEGVFDLGEERGLVEELPGLEPCQPGAKPVRKQIARSFQDWQWHARADDRGLLKESLVVGLESVDAGREHGLDRRRHLEVLERARQTVGAALPREHASLDQTARTLLQEARVALGPLDQRPLEQLEGSVPPHQGVE
jgi:hypothetical protein